MRLTQMAELLGQFDSALKARREVATIRTRHLLEQMPQLTLDAVRRTPPKFNALECCGLYADERQHSAILGWLLKSVGSHGQGNAFLLRFAQLCRLNLAPNILDYVVRTEFAGFESIADIVVFRTGQFLIYIENKIFAAEGREQLDRQERDLWHWAEALQVPKDRCRAVFLTLGDRMPLTGSSKIWTCVSYAQLAEGLCMLSQELADAKLAFFVRDWLSILTKLNEEVTDAK
jgi:hypothetical protein